MSESLANLAKKGLTIGTPIQIYHDTSGQAINTDTTLWTATDDGFITAEPVVYTGWCELYIGSLRILLYESGNAVSRTSVSGFIKKGETFRFKSDYGSGIRGDMNANFTSLG